MKFLSYFPRITEKLTAHKILSSKQATQTRFYQIKAIYFYKRDPVRIVLLPM